MSRLDVLTAYDQKKIESLPIANEKEVFSILAKSHSLFQDRSKWMSIARRIQILEKTIEIVQSKRDDLALQASYEGGKPLADSIIEVDRGINGIKVALKEISQLHGTEIPMGITKSSEQRIAFTRRFPRGVVLAISAFNHPFNLIVHQVIPAVMTGCPVIVKPAETTPLSCRNLVNILYESGLPEDWCQMIVCENEVAEKLVTDKRISFLSFIGSAKVGWYLRSKLPPGATCALEHGGAAPVIVDKTADLEKAIPLLTKGGFYHAGQVCVSVQRIFAHKSIVNNLCEKLVDAVKKLKTGDPSKIETEVGPLILPREVDRVHSWVEKAIGEGAKLLCGGRKISDTCYAPTVLFNPPMNLEVSKKEIFGPVVCIYSYNQIDEAVEMANDVDYAFQASVFSNDLSLILSTIEKLEGLTIIVNDHTAFRVDWMPFGGYKESGLGIGGIGHTIKDMTIEKMYVFNRNDRG